MNGNEQNGLIANDLHWGGHFIGPLGYGAGPLGYVTGPPGLRPMKLTAWSVYRLGCMGKCVVCFNRQWCRAFAEDDRLRLCFRDVCGQCHFVFPLYLSSTCVLFYHMFLALVHLVEDRAFSAGVCCK
jgi:hypothetical protein